MRFIQIMPTLYKLKTEIFKMFNNNRILVIPVINMNGFHQGSDEQDSPTASGMVESDIYTDFNLNPTKKCFVSLGAQFLQKIYNDNLIFGTLALTKGDFSLDMPILKKLTGSKTLTNDEIILNNILDSLSRVYLDDQNDAELSEGNQANFPKLHVKHESVAEF